jgi:hypothetical protein
MDDPAEKYHLSKAVGLWNQQVEAPGVFMANL